MRNEGSPRSLTPSSPPLTQPKWRATTDPDEGMVAAVHELQRALVEALAGGLDARKDSDGQITFSLAGIEGFRYSAQGGEVSVGYGETAIMLAQPNASAATASRSPPQQSAHPVEKSSGEIIEFIKEILQYPLVWLTLLLLAVAKVTLLVYSRRGRKRSRRRRSESGQPVQHAKVHRQRVRIRVRRRRAPTEAADPQQS